MIMVMIHPNNLSTSFDLLDKRRSHFKIRGIFDFDEKKSYRGYKNHLATLNVCWVDLISFKYVCRRIL